MFDSYKIFEPADVTHFPEHAFHRCDEAYKSILLNSIKEFDNCDFTRSKRDIVDKLIDGTINVVSNSIDWVIMKDVEESRDEAVREFYDKVDLTKLFHQDTPSYLLAPVPEANQWHESEFIRMATHFPGIIWIMSKAHSEILANAANFKELAAKCRAGKVALKELAELLKMPKFEDLDENGTELMTVATADWNEKVIFKFEIVKWYVNWELRSMMMMSLFPSIAYLLKHKVYGILKTL